MLTMGSLAGLLVWLRVTLHGAALCVGPVSVGHVGHSLCALVLFVHVSKDVTGVAAYMLSGWLFDYPQPCPLESGTFVTGHG